MSHDERDGEHRAGIADRGSDVLPFDLLILGVEGEQAEEDDEEVQGGLADDEEDDRDPERRHIVAVEALRDDEAGCREVRAGRDAGGYVAASDLFGQA